MLFSGQLNEYRFVTGLCFNGRGGLSTQPMEMLKRKALDAG
jgi:hypothetical protein